MSMENIIKTKQNPTKKPNKRIMAQKVNTFNHAGFHYKILKPMSIFACIYGFSIAVVQKTQFMHHSHDSEHKEHVLSNVCYSRPPHLVTHRIRNELQKKKAM